MGLTCLIKGHDLYRGVCRRCGTKVKGKVSFIASNQCSKKGHLWQGCICARCSLLKKDAKVSDHSFPENSCTCDVCGEERSGRWEGHDWKLASPGKTHCVRCTRCIYTTRDHEYDENGHCIYCGKTKEQVENDRLAKKKRQNRGFEKQPCAHEWEHNVKVPCGPGWMYGKRCKKCGKTQPYEIHV